MTVAYVSLNVPRRERKLLEPLSSLSTPPGMKAPVALYLCGRMRLIAADTTNPMTVMITIVFFFRRSSERKESIPSFLWALELLEEIVEFRVSRGQLERLPYPQYRLRPVPLGVCYAGEELAGNDLLIPAP